MRTPKILGNKNNKVVDELKQELSTGSKLSVVPAYFTIYTYAEMKKELFQVVKMRFIFTEPTFVKKHNELTKQFCIERNNEKRLQAMNLK